MTKKLKSNKPLGHYIKNSADRLAEAEKIHTMSPGDLYMFDYLKTESNILLRLAVKFWCKIHYASIRKLFNASNASNKGGAHVGNSTDKH